MIEFMYVFGVYAYRTSLMVLACVVFAYCMFMHSCAEWALPDGRYYPCGNIG